MSDPTGAPTAENAGITQAQLSEAVATALNDGIKTGTEAATGRLFAALGADGIKGDGVRMAAALDLAVKSPAMSGEDVAAFVITNVTAASSEPSEADAQASLEQDRQPVGLAMPNSQTEKPKGSLNAGQIYNTRRNNK